MSLENTNTSPERPAETVDTLKLPEVNFSILEKQVTQEIIAPVMAEANVEKKETSSDLQAVVVDQSVTQPQTVAGMTTSSSDIKYKTSLTVATPASAQDSDRIEQEWVDTAKKVLIATIDDPFLRDEQVKDLQNDYLFKRYGRTPGDSNKKGNNL